LTQSDLAALGHEQTQICWDQESSPQKIEKESEEEIPVLETIDETLAVEDMTQVSTEESTEGVSDDKRAKKDEEASSSVDKEVKTSGASAVLYAAFYDEWASKSGKVFNHTMYIKYH